MKAWTTSILKKTAMKSSPLMLTADKGKRSKKRGGATFLKLVAWWDKVKNVLGYCVLASKEQEKSGLDAAETIDHALQVYDFTDDLVLLSNHGIYAGGGGMRRDLFLKICDINQVMSVTEYIYTTCALHGLNMCLCSPKSLSMGDGGLLKRNALQCLHTAYNLSQQYDTDEWAAICTLFTGRKIANIKCPVMTRWECVGECVVHIKTYREEWKIA